MQQIRSLQGKNNSIQKALETFWFLKNQLANDNDNKRIMDFF
jgi:hypothetical protein